MDIDSTDPHTLPTKPTAAPFAVRQAITGLTPPQTREAVIREVRPSVHAHAAVSGLAQTLMQSYVLAPLGWLLLAPLFHLKFAPFLCTRYTLTNRRLMIRRGLAHPRPVHEIALDAIDDVRLDPASYNNFYRSGTLEILSKGQVALRLPGVPEPEIFRHAVLNAYRSWGPGKSSLPFVPANAKSGGG